MKNVLKHIPTGMYLRAPNEGDLLSSLIEYQKQGHLSVNRFLVATTDEILQGSGGPHDYDDSKEELMATLANTICPLLNEKPENFIIEEVK